jgi:signal transduction histidine kinase
MGGLVAITAGSFRLALWQACIVGAVCGPATIEIGLAFSEGVFRTPESSRPLTILPRFGVVHAIAAIIGACLLRQASLTLSASPTQKVLLTLIALSLGALVGFWLSRWIWRKCARVRIDDPVDAIAVHGFGGAFGTVAVGVFGRSSLYVQVAGVVVSIVWAFGFSYVLFALLNGLGFFRVSEDEENNGVGLGTDPSSIPFWHDPNKVAELQRREKFIDNRLQQYQGQVLRYMTNVSHQVVSPMRGAANILRDVLMSSAIEIERVKDAWKFMELALFGTNNMKLLGVLEHEDQGMEELQKRAKERTSLHALVNDVKDVLTVKARVKRVDVKFEPTKVEIYASVNRDLMAHALVNLIDNAISYSDLGGTVEIRTDGPIQDSVRGSKWVMLHIRNHGLPIGPVERGRVFEKFWRDPKAPTRRPDGTGIGLYIVQRIIEALHGKITLHPHEDPTLTEFVVQLPAA